MLVKWSFTFHIPTRLNEFFTCPKNRIALYLPAAFVVVSLVFFFLLRFVYIFSRLGLINVCFRPLPIPSATRRPWPDPQGRPIMDSLHFYLIAQFSSMVFSILGNYEPVSYQLEYATDTVTYWLCFSLQGNEETDSSTVLGNEQDSFEIS